MPLTITNEREIYSSIIDLANEPRSNRAKVQNGNGPFVVGDNGKTYYLSYYTDGGSESLALYEVNLSAGTRSFSSSYSDVDMETAITAKSGLAAPSVSSPRVIGTLRPTNYFLVVQTSLAFDGSNIS